MKLDPTLEALLSAKLPGKRFGVFFSSGEGRFMPNGREDCSGEVVDEDGRHYTFWTAWVDGREGLDWWYEVEADASWPVSAEYREARRAAGLEG